ncbi:MAG: chitobiase/beta-hexosaminidase C-terminal domain-containing protein, partial [Kiritimatiellia bacterium]
NIDCRSDFYTGGHETPDLGNFNFAAHGIYWTPYFGAYQPAMHRNVITVDGKNGSMPSVSGDFISQQDTEHATTAIMEYSRGMQFNQHARSELILHPKLEIPFHQWMAGWYGWSRNRSWQAAFAPSSRWFEEYMSSVDFGQWDCQNTGGAWYDRLLPDVDYAWRTLQLVKGDHPFMLILDDVKLDDELHDFRFNLNLNPDIVLIDQPMADELVFGRSDMEKTLPEVGRPLQWKIPKDEPLLFVKVLNRDTESEYPHPAYEMMDGKAMLAISARTVSPSFKTLIYPYRHGDPKPSIAWSEDRTRLAITIGEDVYDYEFGVADSGRTVFTMHKNGELAGVTAGRPPHPVLAGLPPVHQGSRYEKEGPDLGPPPQPRDPAPVPVKVFTDTATLTFETTGPAQEIRYTTDGSEPGPASTLYSGPVTLEEAATVKARTFSRYWPWGDETVSESAEARFVRQVPVGPVGEVEPLGQGLVCEVFEIFSPDWDTRGFVNPSLNFLPVVDKYQPILTTAVRGFELPPVRGQQPIEEVYKGYYHFRGYLNVKETGVYTVDVLSNGPLLLEVAREKVIEETGYYHQDNKHRYGQVALASGLHPVSLVVCDPVFWKKEREGEMPFKVSFLMDGKPAGDLVSVMASAADLEAHVANRFAPVEAEVPRLDSVQPGVELAPGLLRATYARTDLVPAGDGWLFSQKAGPAGLFETEEREPLKIETADDVITGSDFDGQLYVYTGWYKAPYDGLYTFVLDGAGNNQLLIGDVEVARNNVPGAQVDGRIRLGAGYHALTLKMARSEGAFMVKTPADSGPARITFGDLFRPASTRLLDDPGRFLVLGLDEDAYAQREQMVTTPKGAYRLGVEGARVVDDPEMGRAVEFTGEGSGLRLYDWPAVGRYLAMSFWIKLPENAPRKEYLQIGREGATGHIDSRGVSVEYPRFYSTRNGVGFSKEEQTGWVHLTLQWGPTTKIYVNGELRGKAFAAGDPNNVSRPHNLNARSEQMQLFVGRDGSFKGRIAGLRVYDTLLTDDYVKALYEESRW